MNLSSALRSLPPTDITIITPPAASIVLGRVVANAEEDGATFSAVVQPFPPRKLRQFPQGEESFGAKLLHVFDGTALQTADDDAGTAADLVRIPAIGGKRYKVLEFGDWSLYGFNRYIAVLAGPAPS